MTFVTDNQSSFFGRENSVVSIRNKMLHGNEKSILYLKLASTIILLVTCANPIGIGPNPSFGESRLVNSDETSVETFSKGKEVILLVHGLGGDKNSFSSWPSILDKEQGVESGNIEYRIMTYPTGLYEAIVAALSPSERLPSLKNLSEWFLTELETKYRPEDFGTVYLVGHSMGGLLIKSAILEKILGKREGNRLRNIKFIYLIATPHEGSDWAKVPGISSLGQVKDLTPDSPALIQLDRNFCTYVGHKDRQFDSPSMHLPAKVVMLFGGQDDVVLPPRDNHACRDSFKTVNANHSSILDLNNRVMDDKGQDSTVYKILANAIQDFSPVGIKHTLAQHAKDSRFVLGAQEMRYNQTAEKTDDLFEVTFENHGEMEESISNVRVEIIDREPVSSTQFTTPIRWSISSQHPPNGIPIFVNFDAIFKGEKGIDIAVEGPAVGPNESVTYSLDLRWTVKQCAKGNSYGRCYFNQAPASMGGDYHIQFTFRDAKGRSYDSSRWCFGNSFPAPKRNCEGIYGDQPSPQKNQWLMWGMPGNNTVPSSAEYWLPSKRGWHMRSKNSNASNFIWMDPGPYVTH